MKSAGVVVNRKIKDADKHLSAVVKWLEGNNCRAVTQDVFSSSDFLVVLGGDGTILNIASDAAFYNIPVLGINLGNMGYLTDADFADGFASLERVLNGNYKIEKRMTLTAETICGGSKPPLQGGEKKDPLALNEFCVSKGHLSRMITFDISLNDSYINTYRADGIIAATPTGSTAYNLSAGGPVLPPDYDMIALTPICPHDLFALCSVVSGRDVITIKIVSGGENDIILSADGRHIAALELGDTVKIKASEHYMNIIKTNEMSFFDVLRKKMGGGHI